MRHLTKAPIKEAIIEIQVQPYVEISKETLEGLKLGEGYQAPEIAHQTPVKFELLSEALTVSQDNTHIQGGIFRDDERGFVCQMMRNRLTISKIKPYTDFSGLLAETKRIWEIYLGAFSPSKTKRIAMRYINEINLEKDLSFYIRNDKIDKTISKLKLNHSYHRYEIAGSENERALVQITIDRNDKENEELFIDIDAYSIIEENSDNNLIWSNFIQKLHKLKNEIFFGIITKKFEEELA